jgi:NAD(P)H-hydrate epimerase
VKLVTTEEMRSIESLADAGGHTYEEMMALAGRGLADYLAEAFDHVAEPSVLGLVGPGNNGGDTLVALAHLAQAGWEASAYLAKQRPDDPLVVSLVEAGGKVLSFEEDKRLKKLQGALGKCRLLLDGLLGTGAQLPLRSPMPRILGAVQAALADAPEPPAVVAVDCPSGVDTDSGEAAPEALRAEITLTMAAVKTGLLKFPAYELVGSLRVVGIGLPDDLEQWVAVRREAADPWLVARSLPQRPADAHKGTFGTALVVAGSVNYTGAALLAGEAAYRAGAGLVTVAVPTPLHSALAGHLPEATWLLLPHEMGVIAESAVDVLQKNLAGATALVLGPGFGLEDTTRNFISRLLGATTGTTRGVGMGFVRQGGADPDNQRADLPPLVIDADGLKLLARIPDWHQHLPADSVLTPHPGEMAVLTGREKDEIQADRLGTAESFAKEWGHVVVLKGALTVVAAPQGDTTVIPVATPALARAGTGDVLTGLIAGLLAQGVGPYPAAVAGAWLHAQAGLLARDYGHSASVLARDVLAAVPDVLAELPG